MGKDALVSNTTANRNTAVGFNIGGATTTGHVTELGYAVLQSNTTGTANVAVGGNDDTNAPLYKITQQAPTTQLWALLHLKITLLAIQM